MKEKSKVEVMFKTFFYGPNLISTNNSDFQSDNGREINKISINF
jgi:hypothetical protein